MTYLTRVLGMYPDRLFFITESNELPILREQAEGLQFQSRAPSCGSGPEGERGVIVIALLYKIAGKE